MSLPRRSVLAFGAAASLAALPWTSRAARPPLRIGWVFALANAPAAIATQKGLFAAEGLDADVRSFTDGPVLEQAVAAGEIDVAYVGAPPVYQWLSRGLEARIVAKVNSGQAALVTASSGPIRGLADLRGRRVASVAKGSGMDVLLRGLVLKQQAGLDPDHDLDIVAMPAPNMAAALERGVVDAAFLWEPFVSQAVLRGTARIVLDMRAALGDYPWYVIAAPARTLKDRPDDVLRVLRAHRRAIAFLGEQAAESDAVLASAFRLAEVPAPGGRVFTPGQVVHEARQRIAWSDALVPGDLVFFQRLIDQSAALGFIGKPVRAEQAVDLGWQQRLAAGNAR